MRRLLITGGALAGGIALLSGWLLAAGHSGALPAGDYDPLHVPVTLLTGPDAEQRRRELIRDALPRPDDDVVVTATKAPRDAAESSPLICRFVATSPTGTSAKFDCVLDGGDVVKVKYGRNPEIHAEVAATRVLSALGYLADDVRLVERIRCYGCPRYPFFTMKLAASPLALLAPDGYESGYTDFEWASVERKFDAPAIETESSTGWAWWELEASRVPRGELDAFRLLAVFLAHWDNKSDNQRLVCMDGTAAATGACRRPALVIQDLGATFGPSKVNLARWRQTPVWADRGSCLVSMDALPSHGATFPAAQISEAGRALLAARLSGLTRETIRAIFTEARFPEFQSATDDTRDLQAWTGAFEHRVRQIVEAEPCRA